MFELDFDRLHAVLSAAGLPRVIVVKSSSNPNGRVMTTRQQQPLYELCIQHDLILLSDEMFDRIVFYVPARPVHWTWSTTSIAIARFVISSTTN